MGEITYKDIDGFFGYGELYENIVKKCPQGETIVEIGAYHGRSTSYLLEMANKYKKDIHIVVIDHFEGSVEHNKQSDHYGQFISNMENLKYKYPHQLIKEYSHEAANQFEDKSVYFAMIDASHEYEDVKRDILTWLPKIKKGGMLSGDDYDWPGVRRAVSEIFPEADVCKRSGGDCCHDITAGNYWMKEINED